MGVRLLLFIMRWVHNNVLFGLVCEFIFERRGHLYIIISFIKMLCQIGVEEHNPILY